MDKKLTLWILIVMLIAFLIMAASGDLGASCLTCDVGPAPTSEHVRTDAPRPTKTRIPIPCGYPGPEDTCNAPSTPTYPEPYPGRKS